MPIANRVTVSNDSFLIISSFNNALRKLPSELVLAHQAEQFLRRPHESVALEQLSHRNVRTRAISARSRPSLWSPSRKPTGPVCLHTR
jgi:hypothetical protein